jgi:hypothetical protein
MAEGPPLQASTYAVDLRIPGWRHLIFNLLAYMPMGTLFSSSGVVFLNPSIPSDIVLIDGVGHREWKLQHEIGGGGPDCLFSFCFRILFAEV